MRVPLALVLLLLLAGCTTPAPPPRFTPPPEPDIATPATLVEIDGRWAFDETAARALVTTAGGRDVGALLYGEARIGLANASVGGAVASFDAPTLAALGRNASLPAPGEVILSPNASDALHARPGDEVTLTATVWPAPKVLAAFEMERVRPCDPGAPTPVCARAPEPEGTAVLSVQVPLGSSDLEMRPDVVELPPAGFPARWEGTFRSPSGETTPFETSAASRAETTAPGRIAGPLAPGEWTIRFRLTANGTVAPPGAAGLVTFRVPGYASFDIDLLSEPDAGRQTRMLLANATSIEVHARVASVASAPFHVAALLAPSDARRLLGVPEGNVTALALPTRAGVAAAVRDAAARATDAGIRALLARPASDAPAAPPARVAWAPPDAAATVEGGPPLGGALSIGGKPVPARVLTLPAAPPWRLLPGGHWNATAFALADIAKSPHLVLVAADLARAAGLDPANLTYTQISADSATGSRTLFIMGAVEGGPPDAVWASAALVAGLGRPVGPRAVAADGSAGGAQFVT